MLSLKGFLFGFLFTLIVYGVQSLNSLNEKNVIMYVFGDSLYDPGNNNYLNLSYASKANYWPYGESFFKYPSGRYCDGRITPDFIAMDVKLPLWKPYLEANGTQQSIRNGANFAAGGASALRETTGQIGLNEQLSFFKTATSKLQKEVGKAEAEKILMEAVYLSSIGGVDYYMFIGEYSNSTEVEKEEYVNMVIGNITNVIKEIYKMGGRKFAVQNVGPMGCMPRAKQIYGLPGDECLEELQELAILHNDLLLKEAEALKNQLRGLEYLIFDYYTSLYNIIQNPSKYGFNVTTVACCGYGTNRGSNCGIEPYELCRNPDEYVFFDGSHPGEHSNSLLSQLLWNDDSAVTVPYNLKQLVELQIISDFSLGSHVVNATENSDAIKNM